MKRPLTRLNVALALGVLALLVVVGLHVKGRLTPPRAGETATGVASPRIGGHFTLVDEDGRTVTDADFRGRFMLVYFGYTDCPNVCPTTLGVVAEAVDRLGERAEQVTPVFISVDPERDRPERLKTYVAAFHPRMVGLTGDAEQVKAAAKGYRVYYAKAEGGDADDTLVDHTSVVYLMGPDGSFRTHFSHGTDADAMAERILKHL